MMSRLEVSGKLNALANELRVGGHGLVAAVLHVLSSSVLLGRENALHDALVSYALNESVWTMGALARMSKEPQPPEPEPGKDPEPEAAPQPEPGAEPFEPGGRSKSFRDFATIEEMRAYCLEHAASIYVRARVTVPDPDGGRQHVRMESVPLSDLPPDMIERWVLKFWQDRQAAK